MKRARWAAAALGVYGLGSLALLLALVTTGRVAGPHEGWPAVVGACVAVAVAALLAVHLPRHPLTWALAVYALAHCTGVGLSNLLIALAEEGAVSLATTNVVVDTAWVGTLPMLPLIAALVPDGATANRWRHVVRAQVAALVLLLLMVLADGGSEGPGPTMAAAVVVLLTLFSTGAVAVARIIVRVVRDERARTQLGAFVLVAGVVVSLYLVAMTLLVLLGRPGALDADVVYGVVVGGVPAALGWGIVRHSLFGVDVVLTRVAVATTATLLVVGLYLGCVVVAAALVGLPRAALPAVLLPAALVALVLAPLQRVLLGVVGRAVYGQRGDPLTVLRQIGEELAATPPADVPARIVDVVRSALRVRWTACEVDRDGEGVRIAESGSRSEASADVAFPLTYGGETVGRLLVQPRRGELSLSRLDLRLLRDVADQAGPAVAAARLVDDLTASRERLVLGREAERARLRRDLHDGLSPSLAGIGLALGAAEQLLASDPDAAARLVERARREVAGSAAEVRRLLDELRPAGLAELGLLSALEERARALSQPPHFEIDLRSDDLPALPAAVETAAYRIAVEAMTNAARHSGGQRCTVALSADGALRVEISDDGVGFAGNLVEGVGLQSMRERALDLGGGVDLAAGPAGGARVVALLPLEAAG